MRTSPVTASSGDPDEFPSFIEIDSCFDLLQEKIFMKKTPSLLSSCCKKV
jgi:hypothetical protein